MECGERIGVTFQLVDIDTIFPAFSIYPSRRKDSGGGIPMTMKSRTQPPFYSDDSSALKMPRY